MLLPFRTTAGHNGSGELTEFDQYLAIVDWAAPEMQANSSLFPKNSAAHATSIPLTGLRAAASQGPSPCSAPVAGDGDRLRKTGAEFLGQTCVLVYGPSGYEGDSGGHAVQASTTNPWKIEHIGASEWGRFGSCGWGLAIEKA